MLHYPGHLNTQKVIKEGLLWRSSYGFIGKSCLSYPFSKWAKLENLFDSNKEHEKREVYDKL